MGGVIEIAPGQILRKHVVVGFVVGQFTEAGLQ